MKVDIEGLKDEVKPHLEKTIKRLEDAKDILTGIDIPNDFYYYSKLKKMPQDISSINENIKNLEKWLEEKIISLENAESNNKSILDGIVSAIPTSLLGETTISNTGTTVSILNSDNVIKNIKDTVSNVIEYISSGDWIVDSKEIAKRTASTVSEKVSSALEFVYDKVINPGWDFLKATAASLGNVVLGVIKGLGQLIESLLDVIVMVGAGVGSIITGLVDGITYLVSLANGNKEEWSSSTKEMWKNVMGYVAEDHVGNAFSSFYQNNIIGQWLDANAPQILKSDGIIINISSGIGYVAGIVLLTIATLRNWGSCSRC